MSTKPARDARAPLTADVYAQLAEEAGYRTELVRGRLVREPLPGGEHGVLSGELHARMAAHARAHSLGRVLMETGFQLPGEPHTVRGPDVAFVAAARLPARTPRGFWQLAPDLAVEVRSPGDRWTEVQAKAAEYLDAGSRAVWVVEAGRRRVTVFTRAEPVRVLHDNDVLDGGDILPGFTVPLVELFDAL